MQRTQIRLTPNSLNETQKHRVAEMVDQGYPPSAISAKLQVTRTAVSEYAMAAGLIEPVSKGPVYVKRIERELSKEQKAEQLLRAGASRVTVAEQLGMKLAEVRLIQQVMDDET